MSPHLKFNVRVYWTLLQGRIASHAPALMCQLRASERAAGCHLRYRWAVTREVTQKKQTDYFDSLIGR